MTSFCSLLQHIKGQFLQFYTLKFVYMSQGVRLHTWKKRRKVFIGSSDDAQGVSCIVGNVGDYLWYSMFWYCECDSEKHNYITILESGHFCPQFYTWNVYFFLLIKKKSTYFFHTQKKNPLCFLFFFFSWKFFPRFDIWKKNVFLSTLFFPVGLKHYIFFFSNISFSHMTFFFLKTFFHFF